VTSKVSVTSKTHIVPLSLTTYTYEMPGELKKAITDFVDYYNYRRYHKAQLIVAETTTGASGSLLMPHDYAKVFGSKSVPFR